MRTGSTRQRRGGLSTRGSGIFFVTLLMKSSKAAELLSFDAPTVPDASTAGTTSADGGTSTGDTPIRVMINLAVLSPLLVAILLQHLRRRR